ncbi:MAG: hypothetical protein K5650_08745 [Bacteroidales bacterium]|nr:hypothetical protein [Bacteroidales bacterium]
MDNKIKVMMVDDEPIIRKAVKMELNARGSQVECRMDDEGRVELRTIELTATFATGTELMVALSSTEAEDMPDYVLMDMELQGEPTGGLSATERLHRKYPNIGVIVLSGRFDNPPAADEHRQQRVAEIGRVVFDALSRGAKAFVSKNAAGGFSVENVVRAIACIERGEDYYFNYPVMLTLKEAAEMYIKGISAHDEGFDITPTERTVLLLEAGGNTAQDIADAIGETDKTVQERQKDLARRLGTVNKSGARIAKAMQCGLIKAEEIKYLRR